MMTRQNQVKDLSFQFALEIILFCKELSKENRIIYPLFQQLLKSGTSIGANIEEAIAAQSRKDFLAKMYIAFKEASETNYWLRLIDKSHLFENNSLYTLLHKSKELRAILSSITKSTRTTLSTHL